MRSYNTYYVNHDQLRSFIINENISNSSSLLIQVFSALNDKDLIATLLTELTEYLPDAVIIGSTTDGEIMNGTVSSGKVVLNFTQFEHSTLRTTSIEHQKNGYMSGQYIAKELIQNDTKLLICFADGLNTNGEEFLNGISSVNENVIVAGGLAGDNFKFEKTFVFMKGRIIIDGAVGVSLNSKHLHVHTNHSFNWYPIGKELTVTKSDGNRVYTIDGKSTVDIYAHYLGEDMKDNLPGIGLEFPLMVNRNGFSMARTMLSKYDDGSLLMAGNLYTGEKVQIGFGNSHGILEKSETILNEVSEQPSEVIFVYSCTARRHFMGDEIEMEILPLQDIAPVSGFFTYGEFFTSSHNNLLNQTMTVVSLSESGTVHKINKPNSPHQYNTQSVSFDALTHLVNITREELEKSNKVSEELKERMELALIGSNDGIWDWNMIDDTVYFSPRWKEMLGYRDEELSNHLSTWEELLHPDDKDEAWEDANKNINKETEYYENIHRLKHKDGHWVWILDRGKAIFDENGTAVRMIGTHTDITKEKEDQLKLVNQAKTIKQLKDRQELALVGSRTSVLDWDFTDNSMYISSSWKEMLGYSDEELPNRTSTWFQQAHPKDKKTVLKLLREHQKNQIKDFQFNHRLKHKDGHWVWVLGRAQIFYDQNGKKVRMVGTHTDITEQKKVEDALYEQKNILRHQALHDSLTGLPNRILFKDRLAHGIKTAARHATGLAIFFIDLDKFKQINDSLGHDIGDSVLIAVSKRIKNVIRKEDTLARLGGDEFTVIMDDLLNPEDAEILAKKILKTIAEPLYIDEHILYVTSSIGMSLYPEDADDPEFLLKYADTAMYKAKEQRHNSFKFYSLNMTKLALEKMHMRTSLQLAIDNKEFIIHYQPQINTKSKKIIGIEALVRWKHPKKGILYPDQFIPLAEETGMIIEIDKWVMKSAMKQVSKWYKSGLNPGVLATNLSIRQLECSDFPLKVKERLKKYDFSPELLELEITEGQMMKDPEDVITKLNIINDLGVRISIDDFGTGYSSLQLLKRLPIHRLKIDRSFVNDVPEDEEDIAIIKAIIALAKSLKLDIIAEGVETEAQRDFLISNGCINVQGHYYGHPVSAKEMEKILLKYT